MTLFVLILRVAMRSHITMPISDRLGGNAKAGQLRPALLADRGLGPAALAVGWKSRSLLHHERQSFQFLLDGFQGAPGAADANGSIERRFGRNSVAAADQERLQQLGCLARVQPSVDELVPQGGQF